MLLQHALSVVLVAACHLAGEVIHGAVAFVLSLFEPSYYFLRRKRITAAPADAAPHARLASGSEAAARRQIQYLNRQAAGYVDEFKLAALHGVERGVARARAWVTGRPLADFLPAAPAESVAATTASAIVAKPAAAASPVAAVPRPPRAPQDAASRASASCAMVEAMLGIPAQVFVVRTVDGYLLTLVRLPRKESSRVAFFQHGLLDSASAWVCTGDRHSLAARARGAVDSGFDVFLGNLRGSNDALGTNGMQFGSNPVDYDEGEDGGEEAGEAEEEGEGRVRRGLRALARRVRHAAGSKTSASSPPPAAAVVSSISPEAPLRGSELAASFSRNNSSASLADVSGLLHSASHASLLALDTSIVEDEDEDEEEDEEGDARSVATAASTATTTLHPPPPSYVASVDGIPVHESLSPRQPQYWDFNVLDHTLDVMAFIRTIRAIKAAEAAERRALQAAAAAGSASSAASGAAPASRLRREGSSPALTKPGASLDSLAAAAAAAFASAASGASTEGARAGAETKKEEELDDCGGAPATSAGAAPASASPPSASSGGSAAATTPSLAGAASSGADDVRIVYCGHSMGGALGLLYVMTTRALGRPTWIDGLVLLSPAGLHREIALPMRAALQVMSRGGFVRGARPFPARSSTVQRYVARLLQDLKRGAPSSDLLVLLAGRFFGGPGQWVRSLSLSNYPIGGSSCGVVRHGIACIDYADFVAPPHGSDAANARRYGTPLLPSLRHDFGLLLGTPVHLVAGGRDHLVPACNVFETHSLLCAIAAKYCAAKQQGAEGGEEGQGCAPTAAAPVTVKLFPESGHLDFTLSLGEGDIVTHVLRALEGKEAASSAAAQGVSGGSYPDHAALLSPAVRGIVEETAKIAVARQLEREGTAAAATAASGGKGTATGGAGWRPARVAAVQFPWLRGFSKLELVLDGLDQEARDMGLPAAPLFA